MLQEASLGVAIAGKRNRDRDIWNHAFDSFNNGLGLRPATPAAMIAAPVSVSTMAVPEGKSNSAEASKPSA